jgi:hypothetical protein
MNKPFAISWRFGTAQPLPVTSIPCSVSWLKTSSSLRWAVHQCVVATRSKAAFASCSPRTVSNQRARCKKSRSPETWLTAGQTSRSGSFRNLTVTLRLAPAVPYPFSADKPVARGLWYVTPTCWLHLDPNPSIERMFNGRRRRPRGNTLARLVSHRKRIVLATACVLGDAQWPWWPAPHLGR